MNDHVLIIEAFYGGSHKQLVDVLERDLEGCVKVTLPAKKWHWRARTAALHFSQVIPASENYRVLVCSSVLNLAELVSLRPDLAALRKLLYFHENQLEYPVQHQRHRDFQYGYNQLLSCLVADGIFFNSAYNMESFLSRIDSHLRLMPDHRPRGLPDKIRPKCSVLYFPMDFMELRQYVRGAREKPRDESRTNTDLNSTGLSSDKSGENTTTGSDADNNENVSCSNANCSTFLGKNPPNKETPMESCGDAQINNACLTSGASLSDDESTPCVHHDRSHGLSAAKKQCIADDITLNIATKSECENATENNTRLKPLHFVWPHRWEHDKAPEVFFQALFQLQQEGVPFTVSVLGQTYTDVPEIFAEAKVKLSERIVQWGYVPSREEYLRTLAGADVVISTAKHEFFGVAMIEAAYLGCYPICPNRLVYPEIFPRECLYNTENQLVKTLRKFCRSPKHLRAKPRHFQLERFDWENLRSKFRDILSTNGKETPLS